MRIPSSKIVTNLSRTMRSYTVKVNHNGSAVSEIFGKNKQTDRHTNIYYKELYVKTHMQMSYILKTKRYRRTDRQAILEREGIFWLFITLVPKVLT